MGVSFGDYVPKVRPKREEKVNDIATDFVVYPRIWLDNMEKCNYGFDWNRQFELCLDPERAKEYHDETLPQDVFKEAEFCSMCGPKFCSYKITQKIVKEHGQAMIDIAG